MFKLCSFASRLTRDERMQNRSRGQRAKLGSLGAHIELQTSEPADTSVCGEKALLTHLKLQGRLFIVNVRLLKLEQREEQGGERTPARLVFASESCKPLRKRVILSLFFLLLKTEAFLCTAFPRSAK